MRIIYTKHALQRLEERYFRKELVDHTIQRPDAVSAGKQKGTMEYTKGFDTRRVTAIVAKTLDGEHLVLSCWIDPPHAGTKDHTRQQRYLARKKASFWGKIWLDIKGIFGL